MENLKLLFHIYLRPGAAFSDVMDKGNWLFAALAAVLVSGVFFFTINTRLNETYRIPQMSEFFDPMAAEFDIEDSAEANAMLQAAQQKFQSAMVSHARVPVVGDAFFKLFTFEPGKFYLPLLCLSLFFVPMAILIVSFFGKSSSFGVLLQRDYGALATCALMAWTAAVLPFAVFGLFEPALSPQVLLSLWALSGLFFGILMIFALRTVCGAGYGSAVIAVAISWIGFPAGMYLFSMISPWLASPFLLFYAYMYLGGSISGEFRGVSNGFRRRQNFKRFLHNATVNPKDADAHVQLGLIYLERNQDAKALEHLNKAIEIDKTEIDANYELGKIARKNGELQSALNHFAQVIEQNDKHCLSEVWREIGAAYLQAQMWEPARENLQRFIERRPVDPEGLYYLGKVFKATDQPEKARECFQQAIDSVDNSPSFRHREIREWRKLAMREI